MEKDDEDLDLDVEQQGGKKSKKLLIIILLVVVLAIGGVVAWFMLGSSGSDDGKGKKKQKVEKAVEEVTPSIAIYYPLKPIFIVNFTDTSMVSYLQVDIEIMTYQQSVIDAAQEHMPLIRNNILLILGSKSYEAIKDSEGKEKLRREVLATLNQIFVSKLGEDGKSKGDKKPVQQVYFTSFIMQ